MDLKWNWRDGRISVAILALLAFVSLVGDAHATQPTLERIIQLRGLPMDQVPVVTALALQPDGDLLATAGDDHVVRLWSLQDGHLVRQLKGHGDWVAAVSFCANGSTLVTGGRDRQVLVWDAGNGRPLGKLGAHEHPITNIVVSPNEELIAVLGFRAPLQLFDFASGRRIAKFKCPCEDMRAIAFSPDMRLLAGGGRNGRVRIWDLQQQEQFDLPAHERRIRALVFTPDGERLLSAGEDQTVRVWDLSSRSLQHSVALPAGKVMSMAMIDTQQYATASTDNVIRLFRLGEERPWAVLEGHTGTIAELVARENRLISGSFDTTVRVWSLGEDPSPGRPRLSQVTRPGSGN